ncbi:MAG TPA: NYN domain-containing protein [Longimicrobiaceae bacterium]|nr:NYN domain-containing protein [Longimicrobiaceae bacterium]
MDRPARTVAFLVDGLNLYFSLREMEGLSKIPSTWLDLRRMCEAFLHPIRQRVGVRPEMGAIHYFAAYAAHAAERQRTYVSAIESTGVDVTISPFKNRDVRCPHCRFVFKRAEEKETDVAIAVKLLEVLMTGEASIAVLITGDTDFRPAITTARRLFPHSTIGVITPFLRHTTEMQEIGDFHFKVSQKLVHASQFPNPLRLADGRVLAKPPGW